MERWKKEELRGWPQEGLVWASQVGERQRRDRGSAELRARVVELEGQLLSLADAEEQIQGARAQAQALLDNIPHMAWMKNKQGVFLAVNEAFADACGLDRAGILGKTDREIWPLEHAERYMADDLQVMQSGERFFVEEPIVEGGDVKWFETFKTPVRDAKGEVSGTVGLARDITERKRSEEQRQQLERQMLETQKLESLGLLAGGIAHDFNNLLVGVLSNAELVLGRLAYMPEAQFERQRVLEIRDAALHAAQLTNQMLAYSGRGRFDVRSLSLTEVVYQMGHLLSASISKTTEVQYELDPELPAVEADVAQLRQVIMNLITNASEAFEGRAGMIHVRTGTEQPSEAVMDLYGPEPLPPALYAYLEVADEGRGMTEETRARLFEPFFTTKACGRGLGLSAVQGIVRAHGGGIALSTELGKGTTIKILLPCSGHAVEYLRAEPRHIPEWSGRGSVLLVDDDRRVRTVTELLLRDIGFEVIAASTGREAIREFERRAEEVSLVLLDLTMPDLSGDQVLHQLRARRADVPVVICSGYSQEEVSQRLSGLGRVDYLQKPYTFELLRSRLRAVLEPRPSDPPPRFV